MAKKTSKDSTTTTKATTNGEPVSKGRRWSIGLFRSARGTLSGCYVSKDGEPMPYERKRVGDRPILFHGVYADMTYSDANAELRKAAAAKGIVDEPVAKEKAKAKTKASPAPAKAPAKAKAKATKGKGSRKAKTAK